MRMVFLFCYNRKPALQLYLQAGHKIGKPEPLFVKIEQARLDELKKRYGGNQNTNGAAPAATKPKAASKPVAQENVVMNGTPNAAKIAEIEAAITKQGEVVRDLKKSADKSVWQPAVDKLLALKKELVAAGGQVAPPPQSSGKSKKKK